MLGANEPWIMTVFFHGVHESVKKIRQSPLQVFLEGWEMCLFNNLGKSAHICLNKSLQGPSSGNSAEACGI